MCAESLRNLLTGLASFRVDRLDASPRRSAARIRAVPGRPARIREVLVGGRARSDFASRPGARRAQRTVQVTQLTLAQLTTLNRHGTRPRRILSRGCSALTGALLFIRNAKIVFRNPLIRRRVPVGLRDLSREIISVRFRIAKAGDRPLLTP